MWRKGLSMWPFLWWAVPLKLTIESSTYIFVGLPLASFVLGPGEGAVENRAIVQNPHVTPGVRGLRAWSARSPLMEEEWPSEHAAQQPKVRTGQPVSLLLCSYPLSPRSSFLITPKPLWEGSQTFLSFWMESLSEVGKGMGIFMSLKETNTTTTNRKVQKSNTV